MYNFVRKYACTVLHINNLLVNMHSRYYTFINYIGEYAWMLPCTILMVNMRGCYPVQF